MCWVECIYWALFPWFYPSLRFYWILIIFNNKNYYVKNYSGFSTSYICDDDIVANKDEKFQDQVGSDHAVQNEPIIKKLEQQHHLLYVLIVVCFMIFELNFHSVLSNDMLVYLKTCLWTLYNKMFQMTMHLH